MPREHFLGGHIGKWQGRQRPSSMEFSSRRSASPAATWAWQLQNPTPLYADGVTSEGQLRQSPNPTTKALLQPPGKAQPTSENRRMGTETQWRTAPRPTSAMSAATFESLAVRAQSPVSNTSFPLRSASTSPPYDNLRPQQPSRPTAFSLMGYGPQPTTAKALNPKTSGLRERPAGLSKTPVGEQLGLNCKAPKEGLLPRSATAVGFTATEGYSPPGSRFVSLPPNYLLDLDRHRANPGCTKHVPGRRFVDFVSLSQGALLADELRERARAGSRPYFSATSRAIPPADEPYKLRKAYGGGGTCYTEFNRACMTGTVAHS